jgi:multiple sugar transport system substrate-binding protein
MNRSAYKVLTTTCTIFMVLGTVIFSACGGQSESSSPITLTFTWWSNGDVKDAKFTAWVNEFTTTHPNIKTKCEFLNWSDYWSTLPTKVAGGTAADLIGQYSGAIASFYKNKQLLDLSTFPDYQSAIANLDPNTIQLTVYDNHPYALPLGVAARVITYNKAMFKAAGIPFPDPVKPMTVTQFANLSKQLTIVNNGKITQAGFYSSTNMQTGYLAAFFVEDAGGKFFDNYINPRKIAINTPQGIQGLTQYQNLFTQQISPPNTAEPWKDGIDGLKAGNVAMTIDGPWDFSQYDPSQFGIMPMPVTSSGQHIAHSSANSLGIYAQTKHSAEAWEFVKWASQTPQQIEYSKFSDVPVEKSAFDNFKSVITPAEYYPTLQVEISNIKPDMVTASTDLQTNAEKILLDLANGKITPTQAATQLESTGNIALQIA